MIHGSDLFGKVDRVAGAFYVSTLFGHYLFFPLIPFGTYLVVEGSVKKKGLFEDSFEGIRIPLSLKSVFFAWLRAILVVVASCSFGWLIYLFSLAEFRQRTNDIVITIAVLTGAVLFLGSTFLARNASYSRAHKLAEVAGIAPGVIDEYFSLSR